MAHWRGALLLCFVLLAACGPTNGKHRCLFYLHPPAAATTRTHVIADKARLDATCCAERSRAPRWSEVSDRTLSVRQACAIVGLSFSSFYYQARPSRNIWLVSRLQQIARAHPRYGYRRALALLRRELVVSARYPARS